MRKFIIAVFVILTSTFIAACSSSSAGPAKAVEDYWNTIAAKDAERLPSQVCGDWEGEALTVLDSLQAVSARLDNLSCSQSGTDGDTTLVNCTGKMILTYDTEDQEIDLSVFTYEVIQEGGDWLVCGTR